MSAAPTESRPRPAAGAMPRLAWLLVVGALALVAPARGATLDRVAATAGHSGRANATDTHAWAGAGTDAVKAAPRDRKITPGGATVAAALWFLLLGAVLVVCRARPARAGRPRVAFRRRGPPLRIAR